MFYRADMEMFLNRMVPEVSLFPYCLFRGSLRREGERRGRTEREKGLNEKENKQFREAGNYITVSVYIMKCARRMYTYTLCM